MSCLVGSRNECKCFDVKSLEVKGLEINIFIYLIKKEWFKFMYFNFGH